MGFFSFLSNLLNSLFCKFFGKKQPKEAELDLSALNSLIGTEADEVSTRLIKQLSEDSFTVKMYRRGFLTFNEDENGLITGFEFSPPSRFEMTVTGSSGDDVIETSSHDDTINGEDGNDTINSGNGDNTVFGGAGMDIITTGNGEDMIDAGADNDTVNAGAGDDVISGGDGDDVVNGEDGNDILSGGEGDDTLDGGNGQDTLLVDGNVSDFTFDFIDAFSLTMNDNNGLQGMDSISNIETFEFSDGTFTRAELEALSSGPNVIDGTNGADTLNGTTDDDVISGFDGTDTLFGDAGNDILDGGLGGDTLTGGLGADTFVFKAAEYLSGTDVITDFSVAEGDKLDISDILAPAYNPLTDVIEDFVQITEVGASSFVTIDADGGADNFFTTVITLNETGLTDVQALVNNGTLIV